MQTFMPHDTFAESAAALDRLRLGKQRVECLQILRTLRGVSAGWRSHPAVRMWEGYEAALLDYTLAVCDEWTGRGYRDTCAEKVQAFVADLRDDTGDPPWMGDPAFHRAHQSNLIRKMPEHYGPLFPGVPDDLPYIWPAATLDTAAQTV